MIDQEMDATFLSRSSLQETGCNLCDHLERIHILLDNNNVDELYPTQVKAASFNYQILYLAKADYGTINLQESLSAVISKYPKKTTD